MRKYKKDLREYQEDIHKAQEYMNATVADSTTAANGGTTPGSITTSNISSGSIGYSQPYYGVNYPNSTSFLNTWGSQDEDKKEDSIEEDREYLSDLFYTACEAMVKILTTENYHEASDKIAAAQTLNQLINGNFRPIVPSEEKPKKECPECGRMAIFSDKDYVCIRCRRSQS